MGILGTECADGDTRPQDLLLFRAALCGLDTSDPTSATLVRKSCVKRYTKRRSTRFEQAEEV